MYAPILRNHNSALAKNSVYGATNYLFVLKQITSPTNAEHQKIE